MSEADRETHEGASEDRYDVYLYDLPKLDEQGKSLPTSPAETRTFTALDPARTFAAEHKAEFDRIVLIKTSGEAQQLVERFRDGELQR